MEMRTPGPDVCTGGLYYDAGMRRLVIEKSVVSLQGPRGGQRVTQGASRGQNKQAKLGSRFRGGGCGLARG